MDFSEDAIKSFGEGITALMAGDNLSQETARRMTCQVLEGAQPDLQQGAFLAALRMKGETEEEIAGCFKAIYETDTNKVSLNGTPLVENCGTGMDSLKTFNISTLSAIVAACDGVLMARHGARAITSQCGTVDLCEALGVDVECHVNVVKESIRACGLGIFNGTSPQVHPGGLGRILSQIRFGSTLNIAASLANPALPKYAVRGVGSPDQIEPTLKVMKRIGYKKALVVHGFNKDMTKGMDELSTLGVTRMGFLNRNSEPEFYEISPEQAGLSVGNYEEICPQEGIEKESLDALKLLVGKGNNSRKDIVALNAGAILWMADKAGSLEQGVYLAGDIIDRGKPLEKLRQWVQTQNRDPKNGMTKLKNLCQKAGIPS